MPHLCEPVPALLPSYHLLVVERSKYRYSSTVRDFEEQLAVVRAMREQNCQKGCEVTFDDAHASQFHLAFPVLEQKRVKGTFFAISGWVGRQGYMDWSHLRQLLAAGHEVQSHGESHVHLTRCSDDELRNELANSKTEIEQRLGVTVDAISIPNGRWNNRVLQACVEAEYRRIYSSDPVATVTLAGAEVIGRWMVTRTTTAREVQEVLKRDPRALRMKVAKYRCKLLVRAMVGESCYDRIWGIFGSRASMAKESDAYAAEAGT